MYLHLVFALAFTGGGDPPDKYPDLPPLSDVRRFPSCDECATARVRLARHREWLCRMESAWPEWRDRFEAWKLETDHAAFLWGVLGEAVVENDWEEEETRRSRLGRYRHWAGEGAYAEGRTPLLPPDGLHPPVPPEKLPVTPAGVN